MRTYRLILLAILVSFSVQIKAQDSFPFLSEDHVWNIRLFFPENGSSYFDHFVTIVGDTVIAGDSILRFDVKNSKLEGFERDKKTYIKRLGIDTNYILMYDFSLIVGDTFTTSYKDSEMGSYEVDSLAIEVISIDSVEMFDGSKRKRINFKNLYTTIICGNPGHYWIDGIGNPMIPFYPLLSCWEYSYSVDCYSYKEEAIFFDCVFNDVDEYEEPSFNLYPNPTTGIFSIDNPNNHVIESVEIYSLQGDRIYNQDANVHTTIVQLPDIVAGVYFCKIIANEGAVYKRIVVD